MSPAAKRFYSVILSFILIIGAIFVFSSLLLPEYEAIRQLRGERESLTKLLKEEQRVTDSLTRLVSAPSGVSNLQQNLSLTLPTTQAIPEAVNQLEGIAKTRGISVEALGIELLPLEATSTDSAIKPVGGLRVSLSAKGSYESLKLYLAALETNIRIMDVRSLKIEGGGSKQSTLSYSLKVDTYYQK
jgi:Tfp pilus assembly protein PilO